MEVPVWAWVAFTAVIVPAIALEMFVIPRGHPMPLRTALVSSVVCFGVGLGYLFVVWVERGETYAIKYTNGFLLEKGLVIDQVLLFAYIVRRFRPPREVGRRLVFRALWVGLILHIPFIAIGSALGAREHPPMQLVIGVLFMLMGALLVRSRHDEHDLERNALLRRLALSDRVVSHFDGTRLVVRKGPDRSLTLAGVMLVAFLVADVFFAGAVPLAFAYSKPGFLVYTSSAFSVLGFRSLYAVADHLTIDEGRLKVALAVVFVLMGLEVIGHIFVQDREPTWTLATLAFVVIMVPIGAAVRGFRDDPGATPDQL